MQRWVVATTSVVLLVLALTAAVLLRRSPPAADLAQPTPSASPSSASSRPPLLPGADGAAVAATPAGVQRALQGALASPLLGARVSGSVIDVSTGQVLLDVQGARAVVPASTAKIATAIAALTVLPPDLRLSTRVVRGAAGDVVLVGGGDPTLAPASAKPRYPRSARLLDLAAQVRAAMKGAPVRRVVVDDRLFTGPRTGPGWKPVYLVDGDVVPVGPLELQGVDVADPALDTGRKLAALLGTTVVVRGPAPVGAAQLARVSSPVVPELVEDMLLRSDNDLAEALGRQVALAANQPASFEGEASAVAAAVAPLLAAGGVGPSGIALRDASGLSPLDRVQPYAIARLLALAATDARFGAVLSGLPVGGFSGTLQDRYRTTATAAAGVVRGKTGTLTGVSALAGLVRTRGGRLLAFDLTTEGVAEKGSAKAQKGLDAIAAALASCGCP